MTNEQASVTAGRPGKGMRYSGDRVEPYNHEAGTGLIGKIVGPNTRGEWFVITGAHYDGDTDTTYAHAEQVPHPEHYLAQHLSGGQG